MKQDFSVGGATLGINNPANNYFSFLEYKLLRDSPTKCLNIIQFHQVLFEFSVEVLY